MLYLRLKDYYRQIQDAQLQQIITADDELRTETEQAAYTELVGYLSARYNVASEFRDTLQFDYTETYTAKQLVYLDATAYSATSTYALNDLTLHNSKVYFCKTAITVGEAFNAAKWTEIGSQYKLFYIPLPYNEFNYQRFYSVGDMVFWKDKIYKCISQTPTGSHQNDIQLNNTEDQLPLNLFPDNTISGAKQ